MLETLSALPADAQNLESRLFSGFFFFFFFFINSTQAVKAFFFFFFFFFFFWVTGEMSIPFRQAAVKDARRT
ncbi:hypothetical protein ABBQ32_008106 [Trebouxia sp. C0010 RCD-2024]